MNPPSTDDDQGVFHIDIPPVFASAGGDHDAQPDLAANWLQLVHPSEDNGDEQQEEYGDDLGIDDEDDNKTIRASNRSADKDSMGSQQLVVVDTMVNHALLYQDGQGAQHPTKLASRPRDNNKKNCSVDDNEDAAERSRQERWMLLFPTVRHKARLELPVLQWQQLEAGNSNDNNNNDNNDNHDHDSNLPRTTSQFSFQRQGRMDLGSTWTIPHHRKIIPSKQQRRQREQHGWTTILRWSGSTITKGSYHACTGEWQLHSWSVALDPLSSSPKPNTLRRQIVRCGVSFAPPYSDPQLVLGGTFQPPLPTPSAISLSRLLSSSSSPSPLSSSKKSATKQEAPNHSRWTVTCHVPMRNILGHDLFMPNANRGSHSKTRLAVSWSDRKVLGGALLPSQQLLSIILSSSCQVLQRPWHLVPNKQRQQTPSQQSHHRHHHTQLDRRNVVLDWSANVMCGPNENPSAWQLSLGLHPLGLMRGWQVREVDAATLLQQIPWHGSWQACPWNHDHSQFKWFVDWNHPPILNKPKNNNDNFRRPKQEFAATTNKSLGWRIGATWTLRSPSRVVQMDSTANNQSQQSAAAAVSSTYSTMEAESSRSEPWLLESTVSWSNRHMQSLSWIWTWQQGDAWTLRLPLLLSWSSTTPTFSSFLWTGMMGLIPEMIYLLFVSRIMQDILADLWDMPLHSPLIDQGHLHREKQLQQQEFELEARVRNAEQQQALMERQASNKAALEQQKSNQFRRRRQQQQQQQQQQSLSLQQSHADEMANSNPTVFATTAAEGERGGGLVIQRAIYYLPRDKDGNDEDTPMQSLVMDSWDRQPETWAWSWLDVTIPLQFWVTDESTLYLPACSKHAMLGFCPLSMPPDVPSKSQPQPQRTLYSNRATRSWTQWLADGAATFGSVAWIRDCIMSTSTDAESIDDTAGSTSGAPTSIPAPRLLVIYEYAGQTYHVTIADLEALNLPHHPAARVLAEPPSHILDDID